MSQANCDSQFRADMQDICTTWRDAELEACPFWGFLWCSIRVANEYVDCADMAGTYAMAVSYLGDGVVETERLAEILAPLGATAVIAAASVAALAGDIQIEAAYRCPCSCLTCPPDEPQGAPSCELTASQAAFVTQDVIRYHKEEENVSGVGVECDCVAAEEVITTPCPADSTCAPNGRVCTSDLCDPATCNRSELVGECRELGFEIFGWDLILYSALEYEWATSRCEAVDEYRSRCATNRDLIASIRCPAGCADDGLSCAGQPASTLRLRVMEPAGLNSNDYIPCAGCRLQLEGIGGTREGTTSLDGTVTFSGVPQGAHLARYGCGPATLGSHLPSDLVLYPSVPISWVLARGPRMVPGSNLPTIVAPVSGPIDVLTGLCVAGPAAACSASEMSPMPVAQTLPTAVAATRQQIIEAAVACDYEALAALATSGAGFFAYGDDPAGDPGAYWRSLEAGGGVPLRLMVVTLNLPAEPAAVGGIEGAYYLWSDGEGGATGYRIGISAEGEWLFFLGDD
jgi:hypothetical protein